MARQRQLLLLSIFALVMSGFFSGGLSYTRPPPRQNLNIRRLQEDDTTPQQAHISMVGEDKMRITWITNDPSPAIVEYGSSSSSLSPGQYANSTNGNTYNYSYLMYKSGYIHDVVIGPLTPNTVYNYRLSSNPARHYSFKTPPAQFPLNFAVVGDLGQTGWTKSTLEHISKSEYDILLLPGDLSYADMIQPFWDSFGRLVEPLASQRPWMVTQGNHEIEKFPLFHTTPFTAYNARWRMPYEQSGSNSNLYYSFNVAGVHVIMLGSYTNFNPNSPQYKWLEADLSKVNRATTPWIVVLIHAPWYNSNTAHQNEPESVYMKKSMEGLLYQAGVDVIFAGHVHAYERFTRIYQDKADNCGPVHITIGDGGNREGLAGEYIDPKPEISVFREASFGHGQFEVVNETHAQWTWHRNENDEQVASDSIWITSLYSNPACKIMIK